MTPPYFDCPEPCVQFCSDGRNVRVIARDVVFYDSVGICWTAHVGRETDGASIPALLWPLIGGPYEGEHRDGAILHDEAYANAQVVERDTWLAIRSPFRAAADRMLREASITRGTSRWKAWAIWAGVRLGGWVAWREHARQNGGQP